MSRRGTLLFGWALALATIALFAHLGRWQSQRAVEKQAMLDAAAAVLHERTPRPLSIAADPARLRAYDWASGLGSFDPRGALLLDNQQRNGRAGVRVYRIFRPRSGDALLVDLGWLPLAGDRKLPTIELPRGEFALAGLLTAPPSSGLALGAGIGRDGEGWLLTRVDPAAIAAATGLAAPLAPRVLRLDPAIGLGFERDLELLANTLPPQQHRGYAVQWYALAAAVLATALILTFRRRRPRPDPPSP